MTNQTPTNRPIFESKPPRLHLAATAGKMTPAALDPIREAYRPAPGSYLDRMLDTIAYGLDNVATAAVEAREAAAHYHRLVDVVEDNQATAEMVGAMARKQRQMIAAQDIERQAVARLLDQLRPFNGELDSIDRLLDTYHKAAAGLLPPHDGIAANSGLTYYLGKAPLPAAVV